MFSKVWSKRLVILLLLLGIFFRLINIDQKVFWVDEVATAIRVAGYTKQEVTESVLNLGIVRAADLQKYQQLSPEKDIADVVKTLIKSPEHAPLYFLLTRFWEQQFGSSITTIRSLSIVFSILSLPCIYWLCLELFNSSLVGEMAIALLAVSPFYVAYAQEARPYSLWTFILLLSNIALLRAIRLGKRTSWYLYTATLVLSLYTSLLSLWVAIGQSIYTMGAEKFRWSKAAKSQMVALLIGITAFAPWLFVVVLNWQNLQDNTTWMREPMGVQYMIAIWLYSIVVVFVDFPVYLAFDPVIVSCILADFVLIGLVGFSLYFLYVKSSRRVWLFVITLVVVTPAILILIDLVRAGQASATPRYLIPLHLGSILSISYLLTNKIQSFGRRSRQVWKTIAAILLTAGIVSCVVNLNRSPMYQKTRNLHNIPIAHILNQARSPALLAEPDETIDLLSLSHRLENNVEIQLFPTADLVQFLDRCKDVFLFNPSELLLMQIQENQSLQVEQVYKPKVLMSGEISLSLWAVKSPETNCSVGS
jgi:uncharacterized membrane protein